MSPELEQKLKDQFPDMFKELYAQNTYAMHWGIETGDGWYNLIVDMCNELKALPKQGYFVQIKEKFGFIRVYYNDFGEEAFDIISKYESISSKTCEMCGQPGRMINRKGWMMVRCTDKKCN